MTIYIQVTEAQRQAIAEGLRLLMANGSFICEEENETLTVNDISDLIEEVLNS